MRSVPREDRLALMWLAEVSEQVEARIAILHRWAEDDPENPEIIRELVRWKETQAAVNRERLEYLDRDS